MRCFLQLLLFLFNLFVLMQTIPCPTLAVALFSTTNYDCKLEPHLLMWLSFGPLYRPFQSLFVLDSLLHFLSFSLTLFWLTKRIAQLLCSPLAKAKFFLYFIWVLP
jgi:hypothetical protein